jgi:tetratricopeptide (TPR) repeat protein
MTFYSALALKRLGRDADAIALLNQILQYARNLSLIEPKIDYFATSLPAMLLFEDDLARRNRVNSLFLEAQARLGLGETERARELLREVRNSDPSHAAAIDLIDEFELSPGHDSLPSRSERIVNV